MRTKTLYRCDAQKIDISRFPNFHITGSITGMKKLYYGKNALLVRCGSWIYNVSRNRRECRWQKPFARRMDEEVAFVRG